MYLDHSNPPGHSFSHGMMTSRLGTTQLQGFPCPWSCYVKKITLSGIHACVVLGTGIGQTAGSLQDPDEAQQGSLCRPADGWRRRRSAHGTPPPLRAHPGILAHMAPSEHIFLAYTVLTQCLLTQCLHSTADLELMIARSGCNQRCQMQLCESLELSC